MVAGAMRINIAYTGIEITRGNFLVFRPAGATRRSRFPAKFHPMVQGWGLGPKTDNFTEMRFLFVSFCFSCSLRLPVSSTYLILSYKRPAGSYGLRDFYEISRVYGEFLHRLTGHSKLEQLLTPNIWNHGYTLAC